MKNGKNDNSGFFSPGIGFISMAKTSRGIQTEIIRKTIHFLIALVPLMAAINRNFTIIFLAAGVLSYTLMECLRLAGIRIPLVSRLTSLASRARDAGHFVWGPVTLGLGALAVLVLSALSLYSFQAASIAIYALAFGDGISSLVGKSFGRLRPALLCGKSVEGSAACFAVVSCAAYLVSGNVPAALVSALAATIIDALPLKEYDNLVLPVVVGFAAEMILR